MFSFIQRLEQQSRAWFIAAALVIVVAVGVVDYATGREISCSVFYLLAVGLAAWCVGTGFAVFTSVFSVAVSLVGDFSAEPRYPNLWVAGWNATIVLAFYLIVVWLLTSLRSMQRGLESAVRQRTAALTEEMAERERLERELLEISEREQRRIGFDLHDSLCQHLTGTALAGKVLEEKLTARALPEAANAGKVVGLIEEGISMSRQLAKGLHPIELTADGLMQGLEELSKSTSELFRVSCRFECESPVLIQDQATSGHLYRITQEALSNAIKHGKAKNVLVRLEALEDGFGLHIRDDGVGLPNPLPAKAGMGMRIMAHRASMIGATFNAARQGAGGTVVSCVLRYHQPGGRARHE
jgi:signal transduction histidine kinase